MSRTRTIISLEGAIRQTAILTKEMDLPVEERDCANVGYCIRRFLPTYECKIHAAGDTLYDPVEKRSDNRTYTNIGGNEQ